MPKIRKSAQYNIGNSLDQNMKKLNNLQRIKTNYLMKQYGIADVYDWKFIYPIIQKREMLNKTSEELPIYYWSEKNNIGYVV